MSIAARTVLAGTPVLIALVAARCGAGSSSSTSTTRGACALTEGVSPPDPERRLKTSRSSGPAQERLRRLRAMSDSTVRTAAATIAAAGLVLLAAACGGSPARVAQPSQQNGAVAFARCMRSNGVPNYPDPTSSGLVKESLQQLGVGSSRFQAAQSACRHLLPNGGSGPTAAQVQQVKAQALEFSRCVRAHGVPNFPDPDSTGRIPDPASAGIDQGSPKFEAANQACGKYRPPYMPSNAAYNAYARTHGG